MVVDSALLVASAGDGKTEAGRCLFSERQTTTDNPTIPPTMLSPLPCPPPAPPPPPVVLLSIPSAICTAGPSSGVSSEAGARSKCLRSSGHAENKSSSASITPVPRQPSVCLQIVVACCASARPSHTERTNDTAICRTMLLLVLILFFNVSSPRKPTTRIAARRSRARLWPMRNRCSRLAAATRRASEQATNLSKARCTAAAHLFLMRRRTPCEATSIMPVCLDRFVGSIIAHEQQTPIPQKYNQDRINTDNKTPEIACESLAMDEAAGRRAHSQARPVPGEVVVEATAPPNHGSYVPPKHQPICTSSAGATCQAPCLANSATI